MRHQPPKTWGMDGWIQWSASLPEEERSKLCIRPDSDALRVDERGVRAPYGFESIACGHFPTYVMFDITNLCNARCIHCPQSIVGPNNGLGTVNTARVAKVGDVEHHVGGEMPTGDTFETIRRTHTSFIHAQRIRIGSNA